MCFVFLWWQAVPARPVVLEVDGTSGTDNMVVSIWLPEKLSTVLEVGREGDVRAAGMDELHPAGGWVGAWAAVLLVPGMAMCVWGGGGAGCSAIASRGAPRYKRVRKLGKKGYVRLRTLRRGGLAAVRLRDQRAFAAQRVHREAGRALHCRRRLRQMQLGCVWSGGKGGKGLPACLPCELYL